MPARIALRLPPALEQDGSAKGTEETTHYGWDADRLVHTEDSQGLRHTVYEPGNFVPLLQLQRRQGAKDAVQLLMDLGAEPGEAAQASNTAAAASTFAAMPRTQREMVQAALQSVLEPATGAKALQRAQAQMPQELAQLMAGSVGRLQAERQAQAKTNPLTIRHYLCDHLGTPIGLVDGKGERAGQVTWAASYGAWGGGAGGIQPATNRAEHLLLGAAKAALATKEVATNAAGPVSEVFQIVGVKISPLALLKPEKYL